METFHQVFGAVAALCAGIVILAVFFTALSYFKRVSHGGAIVKMDGLVREGRLADVYLSGGRNLQGVRFVGYADHSSAKGGRIPFQLTNLVVFETGKAARILVRADAIRMIEEREEPEVRP